MPVLDTQITSGKWQTELSSRTERLSYLLETGVLSDVIFIVGNEKIRIQAHKLVLMMSSSVFEDIFESGLCNFSAKSKKVEIEVPDVKPKIFEAMLKFLYRGTFALESDDLNGIMNLLVVAQRYQIEQLIHQCLTFVINGINENNVLSIFHLAHLLGINDLRTHSYEFICRNASLVLKITGAQKELSLEQLKGLLMSDELNIDEVELFKFIVEWAKEACKLINLSPKPDTMKPMIEKLAPCIRFGLMTAADVSRYVTSLKIFNDDELVRMYVATTTAQNQGASVFGIDCRPRKRYATLNRFTGKSISHKVGFKTFESIGRPDWQCISFKVDRAIRMVGVGIFGMSTVVLGELMRYGPEYSYRLGIISPHGKTLTNQKGSLKYVGEVIHVKLNEPVEIQPESYYTVAAAVECIVGKRFIGHGGCSRLKVPWMGKVGNFEFRRTPATMIQAKLCGNAKEAEISMSSTTTVEVGDIPQIHFTWLE